MSDATQLIRAALDCGVELAFVDGRLKVTGKRSAVMAWAPRLRAKRAALVKALEPVQSTLLDQLIAAAMLTCDRWNDPPEAREQMRQDCINTPLHLRADLLEHFQKTPKDET